MIPIDAKIEAILADPLAPARNAPSAIGHFGLDLPEDLLSALPGHFTQLPWDADRATPRADLWLESSFPGAARSALEAWAEGELDFLSHVIFTRGEDSSQRLYYYVCELQRRGLIGGPEPLLFDVARIPRPTSERRSVEAVRQLAGRLGIDRDQLRSGIARANRRRHAFASLEASRSGPGSRYERLVRASLFARIEDIQESGSAEAGDKRRLLLAGSAPPDDRLHLAVEAAGWTIAGDYHERSLGRLGPELDEESDDPFTTIGLSAHRAGHSARSFVDRSAALVEQARACGAEAVLLWLVAEEEALVWHVPAQKRAMDSAGLPHLVMASRRWDANDGAAEAISDFLQGIPA